MDDYLKLLNPQQREAVEYCDGPSLVVAGAGSGKTRVLTYKIVHLLRHGIQPYRILALTFTNKAAREMKSRITPLVGEDVSAKLWMGTFHSIFARILRINAEHIGFKPNFTIYDTTDSKTLIKQIVKSMELDDKVYNPSNLQSRISNMKNALISPDDYALDNELMKADERASRPRTHEIYRAYWQRCRIAGAMDFDDLLFYTNILFRDNPDVLKKYQDYFDYVLVDEYQDTNFAQHLIVYQLTKQKRRLCVVGDDAQSIYSFRGANISNILQLKSFYNELKTFKLERNYRSTKTITSAANSLIEKNKAQITKHIYSENEVGEKIQVIECYNDYEESYVVVNQIASLKMRQGCSYEDFAVLYRTNAQSRVLEQAFSNGGKRDTHGNRQRSIPYRIYGALSFYQRKEIKDAVAYFRLALNPDDDESLRRVINYPARGIGDTTLAKVQKCALQNGVSLWSVVSNAAKYELAVNKGTLRKLDDFATLIRKFIDFNASGADAEKVAKLVFADTGMIAVLLGDNTPENVSRKENLDELVRSVHDYVEMHKEMGEDNPALADYLAEISLATDQDTDQSQGECVTMMTVHAAKGLEFKNVIIVGVEENLFPSAMSLDSLDSIEEERRLLYVAITRAKTICVITYAKNRFRNGMTQQCNKSRFIDDISSDYLQFSGTSAAKNSDDDIFDDLEATNPDFKKWVQSFKTATVPRSQTKPVSQSRLSPAPSKLVPIAKAKAAPKKNDNATADGYKLFNVKELKAGMTVEHKMFGKGTIESIDDSGSDSFIIVDFAKLGKKKILLKFAKMKIC